MEDDNELYGKCDLCGNISAYSKDAIKGNTWEINGVECIICTPCEDDFFLKILQDRLPRERIKNIVNNLMSEEKEDILGLYEKRW